MTASTGPASRSTPVEMTARVEDPALGIDESSVLVSRDAGSLGGPAMPERGMLPIPRRLLERVVLISHTRMSGTPHGTCFLHVAPESFAGGPPAWVRDRDLVSLDASSRRLDLKAPEEQLAGRRFGWVPRESHSSRGSDRLFAEHVTRADEGCDFDFLHGAGEVPESAIH